MRGPTEEIWPTQKQQGSRPRPRGEQHLPTTSRATAQGAKGNSGAERETPAKPGGKVNALRAVVQANEQEGNSSPLLVCCQHCGTSLAPKARFCFDCGKSTTELGSGGARAGVAPIMSAANSSFTVPAPHPPQSPSTPPRPSVAARSAAKKQTAPPPSRAPAYKPKPVEQEEEEKLTHCLVPPFQSSLPHSFTTTTMGTKKPNSAPPVTLAPPVSVEAVGEEEAVEVERVPCGICGRKFAREALDRHIRICQKTSAKVRQVFDIKAQRLPDEAKSLVVKDNQGGTAKKQPVKPKWKQQHEQMQSVIASVKAGKGGKAPAPQPIIDDDRMECPNCGRKFNEDVAKRHIPKCTTTSATGHLKKGMGRGAGANMKDTTVPSFGPCSSSGYSFPPTSSSSFFNSSSAAVAGPSRAPVVAKPRQPASGIGPSCSGYGGASALVARAGVVEGSTKRKPIVPAQPTLDRTTALSKPSAHPAPRPLRRL